MDFYNSLKNQNYFNFETVFFKKKVGPGVIDFFENLTRLGLNCFTSPNVSWFKKKRFSTEVFSDSKLFIGTYLKSNIFHFNYLAKIKQTSLVAFFELKIINVIKNR